MSCCHSSESLQGARKPREGVNVFGKPLLLKPILLKDDLLEFFECQPFFKISLDMGLALLIYCHNELAAMFFSFPRAIRCSAVLLSKEYMAWQLLSLGKLDHNCSFFVFQLLLTPTTERQAEFKTIG